MKNFKILILSLIITLGIGTNHASLINSISSFNDTNNEYSSMIMTTDDDDNIPYLQIYN